MWDLLLRKGRSESQRFCFVRLVSLCLNCANLKVDECSGQTVSPVVFSGSLWFALHAALGPACVLALPSRSPYTTRDTRATQHSLTSHPKHNCNDYNKEADLKTCFHCLSAYLPFSQDLFKCLIALSLRCHCCAYSRPVPFPAPTMCMGYRNLVCDRWISGRLNSRRVPLWLTCTGNTSVLPFDMNRLRDAFGKPDRPQSSGFLFASGLERFVFLGQREKCTRKNKQAFNNTLIQLKTGKKKSPGTDRSAFCFYFGTQTTPCCKKPI